jgi:hypothetical protein
MAEELTCKLSDGTIVALEIDLSYGLKLGNVDTELEHSVEITDTDAVVTITDFNGGRPKK